jgi:acyl-CoA synthetase (AMP-forming)/AMP-acid ligase II
MPATGVRSYRQSEMTAPFKLGKHQSVDEPPGPIDTLGQLIRANAQRAPGAACLVSAAGDLLTWQQLLAQLERTHTALRALGFGANDRIALVLANGPTFAVAFLTLAACAACAPLNPAYGADEFIFCLGDLKVQALIVSGDAVASASDAAARLGIPVLELEPDGCAPGLFSLKDHSPAGEGATGVVTSDSVALFLHTSGTTSRPKLVPLRHRNLIASARNMVEALQLSDADRCLNLMPLFHIHGLVGGLLAPLAAGGSVVCPPSFRPGDFFRWLSTTRPSWYTAVPTMHRAIVADAIGQDDIIRRCPLRFIRSSSAPLPTRLFNELGRIFHVPVLEAYSMTEAAHQMTSNPLTPGMQKPGTVGLPVGPEVGLLDESGRPVSAGEPGEVVIRGPTVMSGYEANPKANAEAFVNGWFRTGDQGRFDSDGYLVLTGRLKEQINRGGEKVSPLEIDQVLLRHPDVSEVATFGFPHPTLGEEIAAAVVPRTQCNVAPAQLQAFLREHLAPFKIPRRILILAQMPKGPTGKIQRRQLGKILGLDATKPRGRSGEQQEQISAFESELLELWRKTLDCNSIGLDDDFFEMGGDSLRAARMLVEVEKMVGRRLPEMILFERSTVRQLAQGVVEPDLKATPIIRVQGKGDRPPLFFFHGDYTGGYYTRRLARLLGPDQPFIAVAPHGLGSEPIPPSIEQMAVERLPLVLAARPQGPFRLAGYCNGGMVALEVAHLLIGAGHPVELVALIDTPILNLRPTVRIAHRSIVKILGIFGDDWEQMCPRLAFAMDVLWRQLSNLDQISLASYWANFRRSLQRALSELLPHAGAPTDRLKVKSLVVQPGDELARRDRKLARIHNRLFRHYFPKEVGVPVVYFSAEYGGGPLRHLGSSVELVTLPGGHWGCITTHVAVLAEHLRRRLEDTSNSSH